jgi:site-specific DNA recombinase
MVKKISIQKGQKFKGIELEFDEKVQSSFLAVAPSTSKVARAFAFPKQKFPSSFTLVI